MEPSRKKETSSNIPHMHLFMSLKRRFPTLNDADITDSIQRFGLDKARCEDELTRKSREQHRTYYSSWNRSRTSSRGSSAGLNSPISETPSQVSSSLQNGSSSTSFSGQSNFAMNHSFFPDANKGLAEQFLDVSICSTLSSPSSGAKAVYSSVSCSQVSTTPSFDGKPKHAGFPLPDIGFNVDAPNGLGNDLKEEPNSAPVMPDSREPAFDPLVVYRRSSAETVNEQNKNQPPFAFPSSPSRAFSSPSSLSKTTTSPPSTSSFPTAARTTFSNSSTQVQGTNQPPQHRLTPAAVQEQLARKEKLREELDQRIEDKTRLEGEIKCLSEQLDSKEKSQRLEVIRSKKEIELIQQDNSRLQFVCDEMEREILESGESPKTDQGGRVLNDLTSPTFQDARIPAQPPIPSAGSNASVSSGGGGNLTPTPPLIPSRKAPSPPISTASAISSPMISQNVRTAGNEEGGKGWSCSKCTFLNSPYLNECEICSFPHFSLGTPPHLPPQSPSSPAPNSGGPCYCHHRHHYNLSHEHRNAVRDI